MKNHQNIYTWLWMAVIASAFVVQTGLAATYTYTNNAGGAQSWTNASNWSGGVAPSPVAGDTINISVSPTSAIFLDLEADRTLGHLDIDLNSGTRELTFNSDQTITLDAATPTIDVNGNSNYMKAYIESLIAGTAGFRKSGGGRLDLKNGSNSFSGEIELAAGLLYGTADGAFGDVSNDITVTANANLGLSGGVTCANDIIINNGVTLSYNEKTTATISGAVTGSGSFNMSPSGFGSVSLSLASTNNAFTGFLNVGNDSTATLTVNSLADSANPLTLKLSNKGDTKFIYGTGAVEPLVLDSRQVILSGNNTRDHVIENANADTNNTITINQDISVTSTTTRDLVLQGVNTGYNIIAGAIPDGASGGVTTLKKQQAGTWVLAGENTFSGPTDITGGILKLAGSSTLADDANVTINGGKLDLATGVQEKVDGLVLGSTAQADGTYGSTASDADNKNDTYFSGEGILYAGVDVPFVAITNTAPTYKTHNTAGLGGALDAIASEVTVYAYWSTNDYDGQVAWQGGTSVSNMVVGTYSNGTSISMEAPIENLIPETTYYYTLVASNADFHVWASPRATFDTLSAPELPGVTTAGGATNIGVGTASLRAELTNGVSANVYICWGADAGNTVSTSSWENVIFAGLLTDGDIVTNDVSGLLYGVEYDYVVYSTNDAGSGWSSVETFQPAAPSPTSPGGEIAIYREATGTDALTTSNFDHDWDTTVRENTDVYALNANGYDIELAAGHYLVQYSARFDDPGNDGNQRSEVQSHLVVNGSDADIGWSQGFTRRQDNDYELITSGGGIIEVASDGDTISLRSFRTDAESDTLQREPDTAGIQLLRLNSDWDYLRLSKSANASISSTTFTDVTYDQQDELDTGSFSHSGGDITLKSAGHYLVFANTYFQFPSQTTDNRSAYEQQLTLAGSLIEGSKTTVYLRGNADSDSACDGSAAIGTIIETTNANQTLNVEVRKEFSGAEDADILAGRTGVTVVKLPDDGDYIRLDDSGTDAFNPSSGGMGWDTELELDAGGFTHSDSQVGAAVDDDYLFFTTLYDNDDGNQRIKWWQQWRVNGTDTKKWGSTGRYSRNNENQANGNYSGIILDLTSGDYVEVISSQLGNGGTMQAVEKGLQGVRIGSIFAPPPSALVTPTGDLNTTATEADLLGTLSGENAVLDVTVYWSTNNNDGSVEWTTDGTASNQFVGTYTNFSGAVTGEVASLSSSTTYYFTMVASNAYTNSWATTNISFTTLTAATQPVVTNGIGVTNIGIGSASLRGIVTAGTSAEATIVWGDDDPGATTVGAWDHAAAMGIVLEGETFTNDVSGLYYGLQYNYRVYVTNDAGEAWSDVETFTTLAPAVGASSVAITNTTYDNLTDSSADLAGLLDATQSVFTAYAVYSPSNNTSASEWENDDTKTAVLVDTYTNVLNQSLSATAGSLSPLTTYYYTMLASNVVTNIWADGNVAFTTFANQVAPSVDNNGGASSVLDTTATLNGNMSVGGLATAYIVYGLSEPVASEDTNAWDHVVTIGQIGDESFSTNITGLSSETAYSYRCFVTNTAGGAWSATTNFTTTISVNTMTTGSDWNTPGNWDKGYVPTGSQNVIIGSGAAVPVDANDAGTPSYSGSLALSAGKTLVVYNNAADLNALGGSTETITMNDGSTIIMRRPNNTTQTIPQPIAFSGNVRFQGSASVGGNHCTYNMDGVISGSGTLTLDSDTNNRFKLNTNNTFSGSFVVEGGSKGDLQLLAETALGSVTNVVAEDDCSITIGAGLSDTIPDAATLRLNGTRASDVAAKLVLNSSETVDKLFIGSVQIADGTYDSTSGLTDQGGSDNLISGSGSITVLTGPPVVAPVLQSMVDDVYGGPIWEDHPYVPITYVVTFDKDMDHTTVTTNDFENGGTASITVDSAAETAPGVFDIEVTPTSAGSLILQITNNAVLLSSVGAALDTTSAIPDDTTITINAGSPPLTTISGTAGGNDSWNDASNWDNGIPYGKQDAAVAAGVTAQVDTTPRDYEGDLTLLANANLYCISDAGKAVVPSSPAVLTMHAGSTVRTTGGGHGAGNITFGPIVLAGNATVSAASSDSSTLIFGGTISGPGSLSIPARANNNVVLSVANTFAGGVTVSSGSNNKLQATSNGAFGSGNVEVNANWSLVIDGGVSDAINDRAFLSLNGAKASGQAAKVVLNASETIMRLYVDGTQQPSGTYGSSSAVPAPDNVDDTLFSGAGVLTVPKQASLFRFR